MSERESDEERAEEQFVRDALERGEAAKPGEEGELPPGATHEIVEEGDESKGKRPRLRRRRFSAS